MFHVRKRSSLRKYESAEFLVEKKARIEHICERCGSEIKPGRLYYKESLGRMHGPHDMVFRDFCEDCYKKFGDTLLIDPEPKSPPKLVTKGPLNGFM